jgi:O-antigen/teichoic acid export membrane protein
MSLRIFDGPGHALRRLASNVRLRPFDTLTPGGRAEERVRKAGLTTLTAAVATAIASITQLVSMPLALNYLGQERYGMWQTIASVVGMMAFADLGMGSGLLTAIAQASGREDKEDAKRLVSSAFFMLAAVAAFLLLGFLWLAPFVNWTRVFNVTSPLAMGEAGPAMAACALCFALNLPLGIVRNIQSGYQEGFQSNLWQCLGSIAALGAVIGCVYAKVSLCILVLGLMGTPVLITLLNAATYLGYQRPALRPSWRHFNVRAARGLLRTGFAFLAISILMAIGISSDNIVVAQLLGAKAVTELAVPARLAAPLTALAMMLYLPMWAANGEAIARGDIAWVRNTARRLTILALWLTGMGATVYVCFGPWLLHSLVGNKVAADRVLLLGLGAWSVMVAAAGPAFMVLNAVKLLRLQIAMYLIFTPVSIGAKFLLAKRFGVVVIPWATLISYGLLVLTPLWIYVPRVLDKLEDRHKSSSSDDSGSHGTATDHKPCLIGDVVGGALAKGTKE